MATAESIAHYACAILIENGKILLGKRSPHRRAYPGCWDVLGGKVEAGERLEAALVRELDEEIGIVPTSINFIQSVEDRSPAARGNAVYHFFIVSAWTGGEPSIRNHEHTSLEWFDPATASALPDLALPEYSELFRRLAPIIPKS